MFGSYEKAPSFVKEFVDTTISHEGEAYTNIVEDSGGETKYGVTKKSAYKYQQLFPRYSWGGDMENLPLPFAQDLYACEFFLVPKFDIIAEVSEMIAQELFDTGVNTGYHRPSVWLQEELNLCNRRQKDYPNIVVDGKIGGKTVEALKAFLSKRGSSGERMLYNNLNCCQQQHYRQCALNEGEDDKDELFYVGWCLNRLNFK